MMSCSLGSLLLSATWKFREILLVAKCMLYSCTLLGLYGLKILDLALFHVTFLVVGLG